MAKMKYFGKAMSVVRLAPHNSAGKLKSQVLANHVREMLLRIRTKEFIEADSIAEMIVNDQKLYRRKKG